MHQRSLAFDDVPMFGVIRGRQLLGRSGDEIRNNRVDDDATAADKEPGLSGGAKVG
jgi:hypothetical protein